MEKTLTAPSRLDTCRSCEWIEAVAGAGFECRRHPPLATVIALPEQNPLNGQMSVRLTTISARPGVKPDEWCGEYRRVANHS